MERIVIVGQTCTGKSTLARILAARHGLPLIDLDAIHFVAGLDWVEREMDEKRRLIAEVAPGERWVIDGFSNFMKPSLIGRVDTVIWIDLPPIRVAPRVVARTLRRWALRERVCGDNLENPLQLFARSGLLAYLAKSGRKNAEKYAVAFEELQAAGATGHRFLSTQHAVDWSRSEETSPVAERD